MTFKTFLKKVLVPVVLMITLSACTSPRITVPLKVHLPEAQPLMFVQNDLINSANRSMLTKNNTQIAKNTQALKPKSSKAKTKRSSKSTIKHEDIQLAAYYYLSQQPNRKSKKKQASSPNVKARLANYSKPDNLALAAKLLKPSTDPRSRLVKASLSQLGVKYKYGGTTQSGFDCSGLIQHIYDKNGIKVPRTAAKQRDKSKTIHQKQLQPGDLIFFKTGVRTNHVGIYIGDRQFVHASSGSRKVKIDSLDKAYWKKRLVKYGSYLST